GIAGERTPGDDARLAKRSDVNGPAVSRGEESPIAADGPVPGEGAVGNGEGPSQGFDRAAVSSARVSETELRTVATPGEVVGERPPGDVEFRAAAEDRAATGCHAGVAHGRIVGECTATDLDRAGLAE